MRGSESSGTRDAVADPVRRRDAKGDGSTTMTLRAERRRAPRGKPSTDLRMSLPGMSAPARVRDMSSSGVCCTTDRPLPVLSHVRLAFEVAAESGSREIACGGAVVRCVKDGRASGGGPATYEVAIFFTDLRETDRAALDEFVSALRVSGHVA